MSADKDYKIQIHYVSRLSAYGPLKLLSYLSLCSLGLYLAKAFNHDMFQLCKRLQNAVIWKLANGKKVGPTSVIEEFLLLANVF